MHLIDPSSQVDVERLDDEVAEVHRGRTNRVEDAGAIASTVFLLFVGFFVGVLCCLIRITLIKVLLVDDVVFL